MTDLGSEAERQLAHFRYQNRTGSYRPTIRRRPRFPTKADLSVVAAEISWQKLGGEANGGLQALFAETGHRTLPLDRFSRNVRSFRHMDEAFQHPDPDWAPKVNYGDPIPMKWVRVDPGLWFVWPPRQFYTDEPDGPNLWRTDDTYYKPDRPSGFASTNPAPPQAGLLQSPINFLDDHPASWGGYPDGRTAVVLGDFEIAFETIRVRFGLARSFPRHRLGYFYPRFIKSPPTNPPSEWASIRCGGLSPPMANERLWYYPTPDGRRWVGTFHIEPNGVEFGRCSALPPPLLPTEDEVAAEAALIEQEKDVHGDCWPRSQMIRDMATSDEFMDSIKEDKFAQQCRLFFLHNEFVHLNSGKRVRSTSDDEGAWILADLRCYRESLYDVFPKEEDPAAVETIIRLFADVGYAPLVVEFDEAAHLATLKSIWETMPAKLKQNICDEQGKVNALVLAWAMGEFWSREGDWNLAPLPAGDEFRLQGGYLPDAIQIAKMVEEGRLSGSEK